MKHNTRAPRPLLRNASTSALTHCDCAAAGEHTTTSVADWSSASRIVLLRSPALGNSSRSRNIAPSLAGIGPSMPGVPTSRAGTR